LQTESNMQNWNLELIRKMVVHYNFYNLQYTKLEQMLEYYRPIVTFQHALLTFRIGS